MSNILPTAGDREETFGRKLESLRWHEGRLQQGFSEKYSRYEGNRLVCSGSRTIWEDVPGDPPTPPSPPSPPAS